MWIAKNWKIPRQVGKGEVFQLCNQLAGLGNIVSSSCGIRVGLQSPLLLCEILAV